MAAEEGLEARVDESVKAARAIYAQALILGVIMAEKQLSVRSDTVKDIVKVMRSHGLPEASVFHPKLCAIVKQVCAQKAQLP